MCIGWATSERNAMETEAQVAESQELRHSSPATAPTNGSLERESEAESLEDEAAAATPKTVTPGSSAPEEITTQPKQGENFTTSTVPLELPASNGIGSSRSSINSDQREDGSINMITLKIWLILVDRLISKSSIQIMKLGLLGDKKTLPYKRLDLAKTVSDIFNLLEEYLESPKKAVQRLIYALYRLGHRRNGFKCVREYRDKVGQKPPPKFESRNESQSFGLCQCLVDICVKIENEVADALRKYCGRYLLNTNSENIESAAILLIKMYHGGQVTVEDQKNLAVALHVVNAQDCIECIRKYRLNYGYPELVLSRGDLDYQRMYDHARREQQDDLDCLALTPRSSRTISDVTDVSGSIDWTPDSRDSPGLHTVPEEPLTQDEAHTAPDALDDRQPTELGEGLHASGRGNRDDLSTTAVPFREDDEGEPLIPPAPVDEINRNAKLTLLFGCKVVFIVVLTLLFLGGGITLITVGALTDNPSSTNAVAYGNTSAVIATFSTLNVDSVSLFANTDELSQEFFTDLDTKYYFSDSCSSFHHFTSYPKESGIASLPLKEIRYFLEDSILSYNICSAANVSVEHHIEFYILNDVQESTQLPPPPYKDYARYKKLKVGVSRNVSSQNMPEKGWKCYDRELYYKIKRHGYYPVVILPPQNLDNTLIKYWYQQNITQRRINTSYLTPCQPNPDGSRTTCRPSSHLPLKEYCIVTHVSTKTDSKLTGAEDLYVNIHIQYHKWSPGLPLFIVAGIISICLSLVPCICLYRRALKEQVRKWPSDFYNSLQVTTRV